MSRYYLNRNHQFIIEDYDQAKTFASFLPGVAGVDGIPMWVYYVNRGQAISCFGLENKDNAILDFIPANMAYRRTETNGFRTFIKVNQKVHELFSSSTSDDVKRKMIIDTNGLALEEINYTLGLKAEVHYFNLSHEDYAGLIRKVTLTPLNDQTLEVEVLDGLPTIWPAGVNNYAMKNMSNLQVAWIDVFNGENQVPFYQNRSTTEDTAEVGEVKEGHFYVSIGQEGRLPIIYDVDLVFDHNTSLSRPVGFEQNDLSQLLNEKQITANKLPSAFACYQGELTEPLTFYSMAGRMPSLTQLNEEAEKWTLDYFKEKEAAALQLGKQLGSPVDQKTALPTFDAYVRQCFVDNLLRGGYPLLFEGKEDTIVYHVYSRIHGDMEREYNDFFVEPTFYSQGNGNFRDVNQNRRNDVFFVKEAGLFNIKQFMELIQLDGLNPLVIKGSSFLFDQTKLDDVLPFVLEKQDRIEHILQGKFTPGRLLTTIAHEHIPLSISREEFLTNVLRHSVQEFESEFGTGFWVDHWTYNMDLIENYLKIYPDRKHNLLFKEAFRFFESPMSVYPRKDKYVLTKEGKVRQLEPIYFDDEKVKRLYLNPQGTNWALMNGEVYRTNLYVKLLSLALNKVASLDPFGIGVMMDADKPGWNDAMNGLPALFGSGMSETVELKRITQFLLAITAEETVTLPQEMHQFLVDVTSLMKKDLDDVTYFNQVQTVRETYRAAIRFGLSGEVVELETKEIQPMIELMDKKVGEAIEHGKSYGDGLLPTFFTYEAVEYEVTDHRHPKLGLPTVEVKKWEARPLPYFLEAPARYLKQVDDEKEAKVIFDQVKQSGLYDEKLKMYLTSAPLDDETLEIGRIRAFTAGWLERESCFMHMEYKYLIGILKSGLYDAFFDAIDDCLPPFMDPEVYGRSILENSSFIASSRNPNPNNHGRGFVARLTGTTSELLTIWGLMMVGEEWFSVQDNELTFQFNPKLQARFFDERNEVRFTLLGTTEVTYINDQRKDTYGKEAVRPVQYRIFTDSDDVTIEDSVIRGEWAEKIRAGEVNAIQVILN